MRICIDARMMGAGNTRGIGRFIEELVHALLEVAPQHHYILVVRQEAHRFAAHSSVETVVADIPWYGWREQIYLPGVFRRIQADRFFIPHWNVPYFGMPDSFVVFIHDLLLFHEPESAKTSLRHPFIAWLKRMAHRMVVAHVVRSSRAILVPTQTVKDDIAVFFPGFVSKIRVTGEGMGKIHNFQYPVPGVGSFLLSVGSAYPHKALGDVVDVWFHIRNEFPQLEWWIVGEQDVFMQNLMTLVTEKQLEGIRFLGKVSDAELTVLYSEAVGLLYPSRFEGFGLPPLEALAAGCPVVAREIPALVEVLGRDGAFFFRDGSKDAILVAVRNLVANPDQARKQARDVAKKLALRHSWKETALRVISAFMDA
ncbi:glycosyltransferase family 4 protein [Candidatus Uhrbacteria bacterium]|nr:glycosyltransferase family 4 protein [Candidatus Uhrbacteria bacterium]